MSTHEGECRERLVAGAVYRDHAVKTCDLEDLHDLFVRADDRERPAPRFVQLHDGARENADCRRVDERDVPKGRVPDAVYRP